MTVITGDRTEGDYIIFFIQDVHPTGYLFIASLTAAPFTRDVRADEGFLFDKSSALGNTVRGTIY